MNRIKNYTTQQQTNKMDFISKEIENENKIKLKKKTKQYVTV